MYKHKIMNKIKLNKYVYDQSENSFVCVNNDPNIIPNRIHVLQANYMNKKHINKFNIDPDRTDNQSKYEKIKILNNFNKDLLYTVGVSFGSDSINIPKAELVIDTGSTDMWIAKRAITKYFHKIRHANTYTPKEKLHKETGKKIPITISYGSGTVSGNIYTDKVSINNLSIDNQSFAIMNSLSLATEINGILGFGFSSLANEHNTPTFIDNLLEKNIISKRIFGFNCDELSIGNIDEKYEQNIKYIPLHSNDGYWTLKYNGVTINRVDNSDTIIIKNDNYNFVVADTGCSAIILPNNYLCNVIEHIDAGITEITDETFQHLPNITFKLGDDENQIDITLRPEHYTIKRNYGYEILIIGGAENMGAIIMGDPLFRAYYCVFDMDEQKIGFSPIIKSDI